MSSVFSTDRRYAFVLPRYGPDVYGGAEVLSGSLAERVADRGPTVEVLTTCALDNRTWENVKPPGESRVGKILVRSFPVDERDLESWIPKQIAISEGLFPSTADQLDWMANSVNSSGLYGYLAKWGTSYDAIFFAPYLFGTTFWGALIHPERSFLIPCLHDESIAYTEVMGSLFRQVRGCMFNARPEQELAESLYGSLPGGAVGMGFEPPVEEPLAPLPDTPQPYILYLGRKETGKNVHYLLDCFVELKSERRELQDYTLVIAGGGSFSDLDRDHLKGRSDVVDLSAVSEKDKRRLLRHAFALVQPSRNESFSIVLMEAWQLKTPVIVHARCSVTRDHVVESSGGLYFENATDLAGVLLELNSNSELRSSLGESGARYVAREYSWEAVLSRFESVLGQFV